MATDNDQHLLVRKTQHLIRRQQPALALPLSLSVLRDHLRHSYGFLYRHGGVDLYTHIPAPGRKIFRAYIIGTSKHQLNITVADDLGPQVIGIPVLKLSQTLHRKHNINGPAPDN